MSRIFRLQLLLCSASAILIVFSIGIFLWIYEPQKSYVNVASQNKTNGLTPLNMKQQERIARYILGDQSDWLPTKMKETKVTVKTGQTLIHLLLEFGVERQRAHKSISVMRKLFDPRHLQEGTVLIIFKKVLNQKVDMFDGFELSPSPERTLMVRKTEKDTFIARWVHRRLIERNVKVKKKIVSNLYTDAIAAGISPNIVIKFIHLFSWDVDFQRDIKPGDSFEVLTSQKLMPNGIVASWGDLSFAALTLQNKKMQLYRFHTEEHGVEYFNEHGQSAQKALMKTPISGSRLSSRYGKRRHPILGYDRLHRGVDFAAPRGTPVYAAGDGIVIYAGKKGAYGNYIRLRHNSRFSTAYAHLYKFRRDIRQGTRVQQGQIIGFVGSTGRSTGPHLHYEVIERGRRINPLRLNLPSGRKLNGNDFKAFKKEQSQIQDRLNDSYSTQYYFLNEGRP